MLHLITEVGKPGKNGKLIGGNQTQVFSQSQLQYNVMFAYSHFKTFIMFLTEREKRHFPKLSNQPSVSKSKPRGRRYIPHTTGDEFQFVPHGRHISPKHTE